MDKAFEKICVGIAALVFGPVLIAAFFSAIWPGLSQLLVYVFWFFVAVAAFVGMVALARKLSITIDEERLNRELDEQRQRTSRQEWADLQVLHARIVGEHKRIWDAEHEFDRTINRAPTCS
jgi:hypothetical protein